MFRHYKGGRSSAKHTGHLYCRKNPWYSLSEAESTSGHMVLSGVPRKKSPVTPPGIDPGTVIKEVQMKSNCTKTKQNLYYDQFIPHREQQSCSDEKDHLATVVLVRGWSLHCEQHTIHRQCGSQCVRVSVC